METWRSTTSLGLETGENGQTYFVILNEVKDLISDVKILRCAQNDVKLRKK